MQLFTELLKSGIYFCSESGVAHSISSKVIFSFYALLKKTRSLDRNREREEESSIQLVAAHLTKLHSLVLQMEMEVDSGNDSAGRMEEKKSRSRRRGAGLEQTFES